MKSFIKYVLLSLVAFASQNTLAQTGMLSGILQDEKGIAIGYANVAILQKTDSSLVGGAVSDADGKFKISTPGVGNYLLRITAIGYAEYKTPAFEITQTAFSKNFGALTLKEEIETLTAVTVQAMRPTVVMEADKMIVSVEGTALAAGSTAYDVLAKSPGVFIDQDGNIQLNGKQGVSVMIDGRLTYLSAKELRNLLEGMSAENIKNIEVISNPSSKYDAEGSSGILNINLKKNEQRGMNGSFYSGYTYNRFHTYYSGANINYKSGKWNSFIKADMAERNGGRRIDFTRVFKGQQESVYLDQLGQEFSSRKTPSVRFGSDYSLNKKHSIGFMANVSYQDNTNDFNTNTNIGNTPGQAHVNIIARNHIDSRYSNYTTNLHYSGKLDTLGTTLSADLDYVRISDRIVARFDSYFDTLQNSGPLVHDALSSINPSGYNIYSGNVDFTRPLANGRKLELGAKASRVISDNDLRFFFDNSELPQLDENRSNHFIYQENILAAYVNFSTKLGKKVNLQAGLRAENTLSEGNSKTTGQVTERSYLDLFPSLFVQQRVSENYQVNYNYSRRIQRPHYQQLNPFIFYLDPFTWSQGNPNIRPQYTHALSVTQTFKQTYNLIMEYRLIKDFMAEVPSQDTETGTTVFNRSNVDDAQNLSLTAVAPVKIMKNWDTNNTLVVSYQQYSTIIDNKQLMNDGIFYMLQSNHNILLPLGLKMEVNAGHRGPGVWGLYRFEGQYWVNLGLKKSFMNDKLDISLNANDIFKTQKMVGGANLNGNVNQFDQYHYNRNLGINLRYRFSKGEKFEAGRRNNNLEELNRAGGN